MVQVIKLQVMQGDKIHNRTMRDHTEALHYLIGMIEEMTDVSILVESVDEDDPIYSINY